MNNRVLSVTSACLLCILSVASAGNPGTRGFSSAANTTMDDLYRPFMINNVFNYYGNNGDGSFNKFSTSNEGFEFTKGTGKTCIFEDGVVWGGYHKGRTEKNPQGIFVVQAKVGGSTYMHGLSAGPIVQWGTATTDPLADDPTNPANRIYRVRPDYRTADLSSEVLDQGGSASDIRAQYDKDWKYLGMKELRKQAHFSEGVAFDGQRFYISYLDTSQRTHPGFWPFYPNVHLAAFDRNWNLVEDVTVTNYTAANNVTTGRPWLLLHGNRVYVSYDVTQRDVNNKNMDILDSIQAYVAVYELTGK